MKVVFFDLETTGTLVNKHGIHQLSGEIIIDGVVKETFDFRVQPNPQAMIEQGGFGCSWSNERADPGISSYENGIQAVCGYALNVCRSLQQAG